MRLDLDKLASRKPSLRTAVDPRRFDRVVVAYSGGKDSLACVLHLLEMGVPENKIELWHHRIDPPGRSFT